MNEDEAPTSDSRKSNDDVESNEPKVDGALQVTAEADDADDDVESNKPKVDGALQVTAEVDDADDAKTESFGKLLRETFDMVSDTFIYFVHIIWCVYLILIPNFWYALQYDADGSGEIDQSELKTLMAQLGE